VFERQLVFAEIDPNPAANGPRCRQVRIEGECPIDASGAIVEITTDKSERKRACR
jgi:hypothetical protein